MDRLPRIDSVKSLAAWLATRPPEDALVVAHRAALRVAPIWFAGLGDPWARLANATAIPVLWMNLVASAARGKPDAEIRIKAFNSGVVADEALGSVSPRKGPHVDAFKAAHSVVRGISSNLIRYFVAIRSNSFFERVAAEVDLLDSCQSDVNALLSGADLSVLPLWANENPLAPLWQQSQPFLRDTSGGDFWIDWYQRVLDGRPQDWLLLRDVALIDIDLWRDGGTLLDREIARIIERHRLLDEVRRLKAGLAEAFSATAAPPHRGHNHPPELLSDPVLAITGAVSAIPDQLDQVEDELRKRHPSPSRLHQIGLALRGAVASVLAYCAGLGDEVLKGAAKEIGASVGKWTGRLVVAWVASQALDFNKLADALIRFAGL